jgi:hypothetical protein
VVAATLLAGVLLPGAASAQIAVAGDLIFVEENVRPGTTYSGSITVTNLGDQVATASVYLNDVEFDGSRQAYLEAGSLARSNAGWIELELGSVQLEGGESGSFGYTVNVPDDPDLHDSYWSILMVENVPTGEATPGQGLQIRSLTRYGVYLVTSMSEQTPIELTFAEPALRLNGDEGASFSVSIANSGAWLVRPESYLDLYDGNGAHIGRVDGARALIFPGGQVERRYPLGRLAAGTYTAIVLVDAGGEAVFGARYTLQVRAP